MPPDETLERRSQELYAEGYRELKKSFDAEVSMVRMDTGFGIVPRPAGQPGVRDLPPPRGWRREPCPGREGHR